MTRIDHPDGTYATTAYGVAPGAGQSGYCALATDEQNHARKNCTDALGHLTSVMEDPGGLNYLTTYSYDALDDLLSVSQSGQGRSFLYNSFSWLKQATNPENGTINYTYDGNGNVLTKTDARGTTSYNYDELNRPLYKTYSDTSTVRACYAYDEFSPPWAGEPTGPPNTVGHLTASWSVQDDASVVAANEWYQFDPMGRQQLGFQCTPATCGLGNYSLAMGYNLMGNETGFSDPSMARSTGYDSTDRIQGFSATLPGMGDQTLLSNTQYGPVGLTQATLGSGGGALTEMRGYNNRMWLQSLSVGSVYSLGLAYAGNGNVTSANDYVNGNWNYSLYDGVNRLKTATNTTTGQTFSYNFDAWGNMTCTYSPGPGTCLALTYDTVNKSNRILDGVHQYDNNVAGGPGNMTADGTHGYVYDLENRITCVVGTDGFCTSPSATLYLYDAQGNRVGKQQADTLEDYVYDPQGRVTSVYYNGAASASRAEIYTPEGRHIATWNPNAANGPLFLNHVDWLGTERMRTYSSNGNEAERCTDTPYGMNLNCIPAQGDTSPMHFTGKQRDYESGLDNFGARYNESSIGRFMTPDPLGQVAAEPGDPQTWNAYAYARNNPTTLTDPEGTDVQVCLNNGNGGQDCQWYSDQDYAKYAAAQNSTDQGITAPLANDQNLGHPSGDIMCGSSVCGTVTYGEAPSQDTTDSVVNLGLAAWGLGRAAVSFGAGLVEGAFDRLLGTAGEEATSAIAGGATAYPAEIAGYKVSEHVFERMAQDLGHRVPSQVVEDVIQNGQTLAGKTADVIVKYSPTANINGVTVAIKQSTREIIMIRVGRP